LCRVVLLGGGGRILLVVVGVGRIFSQVSQFLWLWLEERLDLDLGVLFVVLFVAHLPYYLRL